jgi:hypothetical protein
VPECSFINWSRLFVVIGAIYLPDDNEKSFAAYRKFTCSVEIIIQCQYTFPPLSYLLFETSQKAKHCGRDNM